MESHLHHQIVPLSHCYMEYVQTPEHWSETAGCRVVSSVYIRTVDYSEIVDACLDDLPEGRYL